MAVQGSFSDTSNLFGKGFVGGQNIIPTTYASNQKLSVIWTTTTAGSGTASNSGSTVTVAGATPFTNAHIGQYLTVSGNHYVINQVSSTTQVNVSPTPSPSFSGATYSLTPVSLASYTSNTYHALGVGGHFAASSAVLSVMNTAGSASIGEFGSVKSIHIVKPTDDLSVIGFGVYHNGTNWLGSRGTNSSRNAAIQVDHTTRKLSIGFGTSTWAAISSPTFAHSFTESGLKVRDDDHQIYLGSWSGTIRSILFGGQHTGTVPQFGPGMSNEWIVGINADNSWASGGTLSLIWSTTSGSNGATTGSTTNYTFTSSGLTSQPITVGTTPLTTVSSSSVLCTGGTFSIGTTSSSPMNLRSAGTNWHIVTTSGWTGWGTSSPQSFMHVAAGTGSQFQVGSSRPIYFYSTGGTERTLGFNLTYNGSAEVFGQASTSGVHSAGKIQYDTASNQYNFLLSNSTGAAGTTAASTSYMQINTAGVSAGSFTATSFVNTPNATASASAQTIGTIGSFDLTLRSNNTVRLTAKSTGDIYVASGNYLVLPKESGYGIKVDPAAPTYVWKDKEGLIYPDPSGPNAPALAAFRGGSTRAYFYANGDKCDMVFHIPHDYAPNTDLFLHIHWAHNGTAISGSLAMTFYMTYAKGHNQVDFPAEIAPTMSYNTVDITTTPRYRHRIEEIQISAASPGANQFNTNVFEPDGIILCNMTLTGIPTITGGSPNEPAIFTADLHYQSTNVGTKQKAPNFWV